MHSKTRTAVTGVVCLALSVAGCSDPADTIKDTIKDTVTDTVTDAGADTDADTSADTGADAVTVTVTDTAKATDLPPAKPPTPYDLGKQVAQANLTASITKLEGFGTRYTHSLGDEKARDWLIAQLKTYGLTAELDPFEVGSSKANNIIARKQGAEDPSVVYIFSAHYDSTSKTPMSYAPGADDNASGVAAVLEAARLLQPLSFRHSLWFVFTAAEEQGSLGSKHMVAWLKAQKVNVKGVIAPDMIGYWPLGDDDKFDILGDKGSVELVDFMASMAETFKLGHKKWIQHDYCYGDDHTLFQEAGFSAISPMDCVEAHNLPASGEHTPHYHKASDTFETLHMPFTTRVTEVLVATFAALGVPVAD